MGITYSILLNDPSTHIVTLRWQDGSNFRDEAYDLNLVYPGATTMFAAMGLPFDYDAALTYLNKMCQTNAANGIITVTPPGWDASIPYQQIVATTPEADRPGSANPQTPTTDPDQAATDSSSTPAG